MIKNKALDIKFVFKTYLKILKTFSVFKQIFFFIKHKKKKMQILKTVFKNYFRK